MAPVLGQTDEELGKQLKEYKAQTYEQLKFAPDKQKSLLAVEDKYSTMRGEIVDNSKKAWDELQAAVAAPKPDEAKVKELVSAYLASQAKLYSSFRSENGRGIGPNESYPARPVSGCHGALAPEMYAKSMCAN